MPSSKTGKPGISLVVQWLRLCAFNAEGTGSVPGQGTRSHVQHGAAGKKKKKGRTIKTENQTRGHEQNLILMFEL